MSKIAAPAPSALTNLISQTNSTAYPVAALATQVYHNLQHQHLWTSLRIHSPQNDQSAAQTNPSQVNDAASFVTQTPGIPLPLVSGIPPHRLYTHPDEQLYLLEIGLREEDIPPERIWVLPTTQTQTWTLQKLSAVFDALPPRNNNTTKNESNSNQEKERKLAQYFERRQKADAQKEWGGKRLLFAMVDRLMGGDGTIVYYVVHDGHVKPRQN